MSYKSSHGATRPLTAAQKLAEMACERKAEREGKSLAARFWLELAWAATFAAQTRYANRLLKIYDAAVVFRAFKNATHVWSLGAPFFIEQLEREDKLYQSEVKQAEATPSITWSTDENTLAMPRARVQRSPSVRARLNQIAKENRDSGRRPASD